MLQTRGGGTQLLLFRDDGLRRQRGGGDGTSRVYALNLATTEVKLLRPAVDRPRNKGNAVAGGLRNADNLAVDVRGHVFIVEDRGGGGDDDIWFAADWNQDGDLLDEAGGLACWASERNGGLRVHGSGDASFKNPNRAFGEYSASDSNVDRTIEITTQPNFGRQQEIATTVDSRRAES